jgi:hypothetical protein
MALEQDYARGYLFGWLGFRGFISNSKFDITIMCVHKWSLFSSVYFIGLAFLNFLITDVEFRNQIIFFKAEAVLVFQAL